MPDGRIPVIEWCYSTVATYVGATTPRRLYSLPRRLGMQGGSFGHTKRTQLNLKTVAKLIAATQGWRHGDATSWQTVRRHDDVPERVDIEAQRLSGYHVNRETHLQLWMSVALEQRSQGRRPWTLYWDIMRMMVRNRVSTDDMIRQGYWLTDDERDNYPQLLEFKPRPHRRQSDKNRIIRRKGQNKLQFRRKGNFDARLPMLKAGYPMLHNATPPTWDLQLALADQLALSLDMPRRQLRLPLWMGAQQWDRYVAGWGVSVGVHLRILVAYLLRLTGKLSQDYVRHIPWLELDSVRAHSTHERVHTNT